MERPPRRPFVLMVAIFLVEIAGTLVPSTERAEWRRQWRAELTHYWQMRPGYSVRSVIVLAFGAFRHALYLIRTEFTMDSIWQDIRFSVRALRRGMGVVSVAVISLALGIGATSTIFAAVDVFMFRPMPIEDEERLLMLYTTNQERGWMFSDFAVLDFRDMRAQSETTDIAAIDYWSYNLSGGEQPERVLGAKTSWNFLRVLGFTAALGRDLLESEESAEAGRVALLSDGLWHRRFGADPNVINSTLLLDEELYTVVGVLPPDFWYMERELDILTPVQIREDASRANTSLEVVGRVAPDVPVQRAQTEIALLGEQLAVAYPKENAGNGARSIPMRDDVFDEGMKTGSAIAAVAVLFLLLITCANVANLLLTRASGRDREIAVRGALGAGRGRIARQFLTEALLISGLGGLAGIGVAAIGIRALMSVFPADIPRANELALDGRVLAFTAIITLFSGLLFGMIPALQGARANITNALKQGGSRGATGVRGGRLRKGLVIAEVSLAVALLVSSTLLVLAYRQVRDVDLGFDHTDVLTFRVTLPETAYPDTASTLQFYEQLKPQLEAIPGVGTVGAVSILPDEGNSGTYYSLTGEEELSKRPVASFRTVLPGYFDAFDIPATQGRVFHESDRVGSPPVLVVNEVFAERTWPGVNPVGQLVYFASGSREVIGVVQSIRDFGPDSDLEPMIYLSAYQGRARGLAWILEHTAPIDAITEPLVDAVASLNPNLPIYRLQSMDASLELSLASDRIMPQVMGVLALIALALSLGGVYAVMAYSVSQRTQEMGIRLALGAKPGMVLALIVRQGTVLAAVGIILGVALALGVTRGLTYFLYGVSPFHLPTFGGVAALLLAASVAAAFFPALRATRVHPVTALRAD